MPESTSREQWWNETALRYNCWILTGPKQIVTPLRSSSDWAFRSDALALDSLVAVLRVEFLTLRVTHSTLRRGRVSFRPLRLLRFQDRGEQNSFARSITLYSVVSTALSCCRLVSAVACTSREHTNANATTVLQSLTFRDVPSRPSHSIGHSASSEGGDAIHWLNTRSIARTCCERS